MLLITMHEWIGPNHHKVTDKQREEMPVSEGVVIFASRLPLGDAIERLKKYSDDFGANRLTVLEYSLLSVSVIDELTDEQLKMAHVRLVEALVGND